MQSNIVCVGTLKEKYWVDALNEYSKRMQKFANFNIIELKEENISDLNLINKALQKESEEIQKYLKGYIIVLDIDGKMLSSEEFALKIADIQQNYSTITFVVGSSFGLSDAIKQKAHFRLSFSKQTFPHQMFRVMLADQIYRAFCINSNIKYHK